MTLCSLTAHTLQRYTCTNLRCICFWFVHQLKGGENYVPPLLSQGYFFFCLYLKCKSEHLPSAACLSSQVPLCPSSVLPRIIPLTVSVNDSLVVFCTTFSPVGTVRSFSSFNLHYFLWRRSLAAQANSVGCFYAWNCSPGKHRNHEVSHLIVNAWIFEAVLLPCDFSAFQCIYIYIYFSLHLWTSADFECLHILTSCWVMFRILGCWTVSVCFFTWLLISPTRPHTHKKIIVLHLRNESLCLTDV